MASPYSSDLRIRAVNACESMTRQDVVELFDIGIATLGRWLRRQRETGRVDPAPMGGPRNVRIDEAGLDVIRGIIAENSDVLLEELAVAFREKTGVEVSRATMGRAVKRADITRKKKPIRRARPTAAASTMLACSG